MRYANVKATPRYCETLAAGDLPVASFEHLSDRQRLAERLILGLRTADGIPAAWLRTAVRARRAPRRDRPRLPRRLILGLRAADGIPAAWLETRLASDSHLRDRVDQWRARTLL